MSVEKKLKRIPYGVSDFKEFGKSNYYLVDKTRFIRDIEEKGRYLFLIRPRRFGKSLFLSSLEAYYDILRKERFDSLFAGTNIQGNPSAEKNSYMIFKLNFSMVNSDNFHVEEAFLDYIKKTAFTFVSRYKKILNVAEKTAKKELFSNNSAAEVMVTLLSYCKDRKYQLYVIIDEYDNFANTILSDSGKQAYLGITRGEGFFRAFFNVLKGGTSDMDAPISRLFMTGVSPITMDDVTSGFNIATNISLDDDICDIMGFTQTEVETMIDYYRQTGKIQNTTPELLDIMSKWYNHYRFSMEANTEVFSTVHILYFIREYLKRSRVPDKLIDQNARIDYSKLRELIIIDKQGALQTNGNFSKLQHIVETGSVHSDIETGFPVDELIHPTNFISLLYYFGLLTIRGINDENTPILVIPNESVKHLYYDYISKTYDETGILSINYDKYKTLMKGMAYRGEWRKPVEYIAEQMQESLSIRDLMTGEKAHQVFWNVYLGLNTLYSVYSEKEMNQGFADLVLEPLLVSHGMAATGKDRGIKFSYIIEIKYIKPADYEKKNSSHMMVSLRKEAETQLKQYSLDKKFKNTIGQTTLKRLILIFSGNQLVHHSEI